MSSTKSRSLSKKIALVIADGHVQSHATLSSVESTLHSTAVLSDRARAIAHCVDASTRHRAPTHVRSRASRASRAARRARAIFERIAGAAIAASAARYAAIGLVAPPEPLERLGRAAGARCATAPNGAARPRVDDARAGAAARRSRARRSSCSAMPRRACDLGHRRLGDAAAPARASSSACHVAQAGGGVVQVDVLRSRRSAARKCGLRGWRSRSPRSSSSARSGCFSYQR